MQLHFYAINGKDKVCYIRCANPSRLNLLPNKTSAPFPPKIPIVKNYKPSSTVYGLYEMGFACISRYERQTLVTVYKSLVIFSLTVGFRGTTAVCVEAVKV